MKLPSPISEGSRVDPFRREDDQLRSSRDARLLEPTPKIIEGKEQGGREEKNLKSDARPKQEERDFPTIRGFAHTSC